MASKYEVIRSDDGGCLLCRKKDQEIYIAREVEAGRLVALCSCCLLLNLDSYLIDNTCEWPILCRE